MKVNISNCNNISQYYCFYCIFDHINADWVRISLLKLIKNHPRLMNGSVCCQGKDTKDLNAVILLFVLSSEDCILFWAFCGSNRYQQRWV